MKNLPGCKDSLKNEIVLEVCNFTVHYRYVY